MTPHSPPHLLVLAGAMLAGALATPLHASDAAAAVTAASATGGADDDYHRQLLAEASIAVSGMDDMIFTNIAGNAIGFEAAERQHRSAALQQAYLKLQPAIHHMLVGVFAQMDIDELRAWITFVATPDGARFVEENARLNATINKEVGAHAGEWFGLIKQAVQDPAPGPQTPAETPKPGF